MQRQIIIMLSIFFLSVGTASVARKPTIETKPPLETSPSETDHRTTPQPGKPEFEQPPPDAVGQVPHDLKKAGKQKRNIRSVA